ncbi:MAG: MarR family transcriptional regulator [Kiritimatiellae bacterium]|nr:MarR family transcriptional regulator [Kiritimatiellia bacterium]
MHYNEINKFANPAHEALMGVWWSGLKLKKAARAFFRAHAVTDTQFNAMVVLKVAGRPLAQKELCERLLVDKSDLTGLLGRMEKAGLVVRKGVKGDKRLNAVSLTAKGRAELERTEPDYVKLVQRTMSVFKPEETAALTGLMLKLHDALEREERAALARSGK